MTREKAEGDAPVQILVSVSKRHFKHAVDRNRTKRQIREAYRLHKQLLAEKIQQGQSLALAFIWLADELYESKQVERCVIKLLEKVSERL